MGMLHDPDGVFSADVLDEIGAAVRQSMPTPESILEAIERGVFAAVDRHLASIHST